MCLYDNGTRIWTAVTPFSNDGHDKYKNLIFIVIDNDQSDFVSDLASQSSSRSSDLAGTHFYPAHMLEQDLIAIQRSLEEPERAVQKKIKRMVQSIHAELSDSEADKISYNILHSLLMDKNATIAYKNYKDLIISTYQSIHTAYTLRINAIKGGRQNRRGKCNVVRAAPPDDTHKYVVNSCYGNTEKEIYFGLRGYDDYRKHKDNKRRANYRARHRCDRNWSETAKNSAEYWSCQYSW